MVHSQYRLSSRSSCQFKNSVLPSSRSNESVPRISETSGNIIASPGDLEMHSIETLGCSTRKDGYDERIQKSTLSKRIDYPVGRCGIFPNGYSILELNMIHDMR